MLHLSEDFFLLFYKGLSLSPCHFYYHSFAPPLPVLQFTYTTYFTEAHSRSCCRSWQLLTPSVDLWAAAGRQQASQRKAFTCSHEAHRCSKHYFWAGANLATKEKDPKQNWDFFFLLPWHAARGVHLWGSPFSVCPSLRLLWLLPFW